jgi:hypothetical protein
VFHARRKTERIDIPGLARRHLGVRCQWRVISMELEMAVRSSRRSGLASLKPTGMRSELVLEPLSAKDNTTHSLFAPHHLFIPVRTSELFIS